MEKDGEIEIPLRITLHRVPRGVWFAMQKGKGGAQGHPELIAPTRTTPDWISFDFAVRAGGANPGSAVRFLGEFTQGPPEKRFVYVNSGQGAGQTGTFWNRRAKIPLTTITPALIDKVRAAPDSVLTIEIEGTLKDGGPVCASKLSSTEWRVARR